MYTTSSYKIRYVFVSTVNLTFLILILTARIKGWRTTEYLQVTLNNYRLVISPIFVLLWNPITLVRFYKMQTKLWQKYICQKYINLSRLRNWTFMCFSRFLDTLYVFVCTYISTFVYLHVDVFGVKHNTFLSNSLNQKTKRNKIQNNPTYMINDFVNSISMGGEFWIIHHDLEYQY